jgi:hypothetical protein
MQHIFWLGLATLVRRHSGQDILGKTDASGENDHGLPLSNDLMRYSHFPSW